MEKFHKNALLVVFPVVLALAFSALSTWGGGDTTALLDPAPTYSGTIVVCHGDNVTIPFPYPPRADVLKCGFSLSLAPTLTKRKPVYLSPMVGNDVAAVPVGDVGPTVALSLKYSAAKHNVTPITLFFPGNSVFKEAVEKGATHGGSMWSVFTSPPSGENCGELELSEIDLGSEEYGAGSGVEMGETISGLDCAILMYSVTTFYQPTYSYGTITTYPLSLSIITQDMLGTETI